MPPFNVSRKPLIFLKDPREYLPYLQGLQDKSEYERKYQVDDDLGRHSRALAHLHSLRDVERLKAYTQKHKLYTEALELYKYNANGHSEILRLYADFLYSTARYKEAAIGTILQTIHLHI